MQPFQEFRSWAHHAPGPERVLSAAVAAVVVAGLGLLLVPGDAGVDQVVASGPPAAAGAAPGAPVPTGEVGGEEPDAGSGATPVGPAAELPADAAAGPVPGATVPVAGGGTAPGAAPAPSSGTESRAASAGCESPPGASPGLGPTEMRIAIPLVEIVGPAANELFALPTPDRQRQLYDIVISDVNGRGGIACRRVVPRYYEVNPADPNDLQRKCLQMADADPYAVLDVGSYSTSSTISCFAQKQLPVFTGFITESLAKRHSPYIFGFYTKDVLYRNTVLALAQRGFFDPGKGFEKLGFVFRNCEAEAVGAFDAALRQAGVPDARIVRYDVGCPTGFATPSDLAQAVLTFKREGVSHVTWANFVGDFPSFTTVAEQQGFRPLYGLPDDNLLAGTGGREPDPRNLAGAIAVTQKRNGEERTPGASPSEQTVRCNRIMAAKGAAPVYEQTPIAGQACNQLWMLQAAVERAPSVQRTALVAGLQATGKLDLSYPQGPNDFSKPGTTTGGQFWRTLQFSPACECWRVAEPGFRPSFP